MTNELDAEGNGRAAAIVDDGKCDLDALLNEVVRRQRSLGREVRGVVMRRGGGSSGCRSTMVLVDLQTGDEYLVSQPLGDSTACRADPQGFARASQVLRRAVEPSADLVICNRFGGLEAEGGGFCAELLELMSCGQPLLTAVAPRYLEAWRSFSGAAAELPPELPAIDAWIDAAVAARVRACAP